VRSGDAQPEAILLVVPVAIVLGPYSLWHVVSEGWPPASWLGSALAFVFVFLSLKSVVLHWNRHLTPKERANIERDPGWLALGTWIGIAIAFSLMPLLGENQLVLDFVSGALWPWCLISAPLRLIQAVRREGVFELDPKQPHSAR